MKIKVEYTLELDKSELALTEEATIGAIKADIVDDFGDWVKEMNVIISDK